ncbi:hypothetical protein A9G48_03975 [Gilliamella sp. wkB18]|uniref:ParB family protein n=1 Tax=Gilliamella sp. wkB18 TaxID=3120260 RepID=UPI00080E83E1|nr:ParB family protein [Gilliamella apicola]OCG64090.1 hypothetical protein A9G48_03975 [Gilliamella apicola]
MVEQKSSVDVMRERMSTGFPDGDRATTKITLNEMPMRVNLDELRPSQVLPRFKKNESYEDIKESIRKKGLDHAPAITKMPGEEGYVISDGGNTRLQILKELYEETGDKKFYTINCLFRPWKGELKSIIGHLTENGLRDDYTFIEKAIGITKSKTLYESELGKTLSSRELSERLKLDGYPISHVLLSKMLNTMEYLYPYIPEILKLGLSRNLVEKILTLRNVCEDLYHRSGKFESDTPFIEGFNLVLSGFDLEPELFNYDLLQDEIFGYFSRELGIQYNVFEFQLQEKTQKGKPLPPIDVKPQITIPPKVEHVVAIQKPKRDESAMPSINSGSQSSEFVNTINDPSLSSSSLPTFNAERNNDDSQLSYTISPSGEIIAKNGVDIQTVISEYTKNTDFTKMFPKNFSLTANLNTFGDSEKMPILDVWKLTENMTTHEYIFSDIAGHVFDILRELRIDNQTMAPFSIDREQRKTVIGFNPLTDEDDTDLVKRTAYRILVAILTDEIESNPINLKYLITEFSDFVVIKFLRIIRLKRVYDQLLQQFMKDEQYD